LRKSYNSYRTYKETKRNYGKNEFMRLKRRKSGYLENCKKNPNQIAGGHPTLNRLSDNSISGQKHVKNKMYKAFKSKKREIEYYSE
jgi:hypothetical protein